MDFGRTAPGGTGSRERDRHNHARRGSQQDGGSRHFGPSGSRRGNTEAGPAHDNEDGGDSSQPPSLAVRLMQVAGEYELERKRQLSRAESRIAELQEAARAAERLAWSQGKQIEALNRQLTKATAELEASTKRENAGGTYVHVGGDSAGVVAALTREVLALRFELAEKSLLLARAHATPAQESTRNVANATQWLDAVVEAGQDVDQAAWRSANGSSAQGPVDPTVAAMTTNALVSLACDQDETERLFSKLLMATPGSGRPLVAPHLPTREELLLAAERGMEAEFFAMLEPLSLLAPPSMDAATGSGSGDGSAEDTESKSLHDALHTMAAAREQQLQLTLGHALRLAAWGGHLRIVRRLLSVHGCPLNVRSVNDGKARTALHGAALAGHEDVIRTLVAHAAAMQAKAGDSSKGKERRSAGPVPTIDFDDTDADLATALHLAASANQVAVVKYLLLNGADANQRSAAGSAPVDVARAANAASCVRLLTDKNMLFWNSSVRANKEYNEKRFEEAMGSYSIALELAPHCSMSTSSRDLATLHYNRARAAYRLGQHCRAVEDCTAALDRDESYRNALAQRAECYMSLFDFSRAVRDFQALLDADPSDRQWARRLLDARAMRDMTHYQVLGLARNAGASAIKKAYRQHCLKWHPDKHHSCAEDQQRSTTAFRRINEANEVLSDSYKRMVYDMEIRNTPASGIQSDGFDRWYQKERDREAERAGESRRLRDAEQERRQVRDLERDKAIAAHEALRARRQQARDARAAAEEVWQQQRRDAAQAQAQARAASKARAQAAVSRAEDHMRSVQALATAHTAALDSSRQQVTNAKRQARAVQLEAVSARPATGNGAESSPRQAASPPEAVVPPARLISKASHARGDAVDSPKPAHVPARNQPVPAAAPPVTANQSTPAASPVPGDLEGDAGAPRRARGGQSASSRLGIRPGIVGERAAMFAGTPESGSAAAPSGGGDDRDRARAAASGGTNSTASFASSYFNSPSADSYDGEAEPTTAEAKAEAERRASVLRARTLARRVEAENLQELDRLRQQQERDAQYERAAARVVQLERERARRREAERRRMQAREQEFKRQVERELALDRDGVLGTPGSAGSGHSGSTSDLDDSGIHVDDLLLSDSGSDIDVDGDDVVGGENTPVSTPGSRPPTSPFAVNSARRAGLRRGSGTRDAGFGPLSDDVDSPVPVGTRGMVFDADVEPDSDDGAAPRTMPRRSRIHFPARRTAHADATPSRGGDDSGLGDLVDDDGDALDAAAEAAANRRLHARGAAPSPVTASPYLRSTSKQQGSPRVNTRPSSPPLASHELDGDDAAEDQVMREVERLYRRERHRVAAEAALASASSPTSSSSPTHRSVAPNGGTSGDDSRESRRASGDAASGRGWGWTVPKPVAAKPSSPRAPSPPS